MKATIEIDIDTKRKYGYVNLAMGYGKSVCASLEKDEFNSVATIDDAIREIVFDYIEKDITKELEDEIWNNEEDD